MSCGEEISTIVKLTITVIAQTTNSLESGSAINNE